MYIYIYARVVKHNVTYIDICKYNGIYNQQYNYKDNKGQIIIISNNDI